MLPVLGVCCQATWLMASMPAPPSVLMAVTAMSDLYSSGFGVGDEGEQTKEQRAAVWPWVHYTWLEGRKMDDGRVNPGVSSLLRP